MLPTYPVTKEEFVEIVIEKFAVDPERRSLEIVERKGIGHPDTLCDNVVEAFSRKLSSFYLEEIGHILHYNVDKAVIGAGETRVGYGGGEWLAPICFTLGGRATSQWKGMPIPIADIARSAVLETIDSIRNLEPGNVEIRAQTHPGAADLLNIFDHTESAVPRSNDTSIGVGVAPLTRTEQLTLEVENQLNSTEIKTCFPAIGEDIKVMTPTR